MDELNLETVKLKLTGIIVNDLEVNIDPNNINDEISLYDDGLGLDSIAIVNFIVFIENKFNIKFDENEISAKVFSNIKTLASLIYGKLQANLAALEDNKN